METCEEVGNTFLTEVHMASDRRKEIAGILANRRHSSNMGAPVEGKGGLLPN